MGVIARLFCLLYVARIVHLQTHPKRSQIAAKLCKRIPTVIGIIRDGADHILLTNNTVNGKLIIDVGHVDVSFTYVCNALTSVRMPVTVEVATRLCSLKEPVTQTAAL